MASAQILIAEDDPVLRNLYVKRFSAAGYGIRTAADGTEALADIQRQRPDMLILDIQMPGIDGLAVLAQLPPKGRTFPILVLTNVSDDQTRERAMILGADAFLVKKDMTIRILLKKIAELLKKK